MLGVIVDSCSTHIILPLPMSEGTTGVEEEVWGWWRRSVLAVVEVVETRVRSDGYVLPSHQAGRGISFKVKLASVPKVWTLGVIDVLYRGRSAGSRTNLGESSSPNDALPLARVPYLSSFPPSTRGACSSNSTQASTGHQQPSSDKHWDSWGKAETVHARTALHFKSFEVDHSWPFATHDSAEQSLISLAKGMISLAGQRAHWLRGARSVPCGTTQGGPCLAVIAP